MFAGLRDPRPKPAVAVTLVLFAAVLQVPADRRYPDRHRWWLVAAAAALHARLAHARGHEDAHVGYHAWLFQEGDTLMVAVSRAVAMSEVVRRYRTYMGARMDFHWTKAHGDRRRLAPSHH